MSAARIRTIRAEDTNAEPLPPRACDHRILRLAQRRLFPALRSVRIARGPFGRFIFDGRIPRF